MVAKNARLYGNPKSPPAHSTERTHVQWCINSEELVQRVSWLNAEHAGPMAARVRRQSLEQNHLQKAKKKKSIPAILGITLSPILPYQKPNLTKPYSPFSPLSPSTAPTAVSRPPRLGPPPCFRHFSFPPASPEPPSHVKMALGRRWNAINVFDDCGVYLFLFPSVMVIFQE